MKPLVLLAGACVFLSSLAAQDDALLAARAEYKALKAEYDGAMDAYYMARRRLPSSAEYVAARDAGDKDAMQALQAAIVAPDKAQWIQRFRAAAAKHEPAPGEVPFRSWVAVWSQDQEIATAELEILLERHPQSPDLVELAEYVGVVRRTVEPALQERVMETLLASKDPMVRANALYSKGYGLLTPRTRGGTPDAADAAAGNAMLEECAQLAAGTTLALRAKAPEFEQTRLQIGMEVPDIEGVDLDGVPFKLSDYRGKVVVLDFWGDW